MSKEAMTWARGVGGLKPSQRIVLNYLAKRHTFDDGCFPKQETIAQACDISRRSVNNQLDTLEAVGLIVRHESVDPKTAKQRPTRYYLAFESDFQAKRKAALTVDKSVRRVQDLHTVPCAKNVKSRVQNLHTIKGIYKNTSAHATNADAAPVEKPMWCGDQRLRDAIVKHPQYGLGFAQDYLDRATIGADGVIIARTHIGADRLAKCFEVLGRLDVRVTGPPSRQASSEINRLTTITG